MCYYKFPDAILRGLTLFTGRLHNGGVVTATSNINYYKFKNYKTIFLKFIKTKAMCV